MTEINKDIIEIITDTIDRKLCFSDSSLANAIFFFVKIMQFKGLSIPIKIIAEIIPDNNKENTMLIT